MLKDNGHAAEAAEQISKILGARYNPANLDDVIQGNHKISTHKKQKLLELLTNHETLFDVTLNFAKA